MSDLLPEPREAIIGLNGWAGRLDQRVLVIGETPKRYRIKGIAGSRVQLTGLCRYIEGDQTALVPKHAVRFT